MKKLPRKFVYAIHLFLCSVGLFAAAHVVALDATAPAASTVNANAVINTEAPATDPAAVPSPSNPYKVAAPQKISSSTQLANLLGGLALIVVLILSLSWMVKRFNRGGFMQNTTMKILSTMPLGTRERLLLIDVGGKQMLLGVTATQVNTLHVFDEPVVFTKDQPAPNQSEFSQKLMAILQQKNMSGSESGNRNSMQ